MSFLLFLRGLIGVLIVFAVASYAITQSLWTTFIQTVICAVVIQIGYFAAILFLVWRSGSTQKDGDTLPGNDSAPASSDGKPESKTAPLPGVRRSPLR